MDLTTISVKQKPNSWRNVLRGGQIDGQLQRLEGLRHGTDLETGRLNLEGGALKVAASNARHKLGDAYLEALKSMEITDRLDRLSSAAGGELDRLALEYNRVGDALKPDFSFNSTEESDVLTFKTTEIPKDRADAIKDVFARFAQNFGFSVIPTDEKKSEIRLQDTRSGLELKIEFPISESTGFF
jgi:hypothetical protein